MRILKGVEGLAGRFLGRTSRRAVQPVDLRAEQRRAIQASLELARQGREKLINELGHVPNSQMVRIFDASIAKQEAQLEELNGGQE